MILWEVIQTTEYYVEISYRGDTEIGIFVRWCELLTQGGPMKQGYLSVNRAAKQLTIPGSLSIRGLQGPRRMLFTLSLV